MPMSKIVYFGLLLSGVARTFQSRGKAAPAKEPRACHTLMTVSHQRQRQRIRKFRACRVEDLPIFRLETARPAATRRAA